MQQNGLFERLSKETQKKAELYRDRPVPSRLSHAEDNRSWLFDPSIFLDRDIFAQDGKKIASKGKKINPLLYVSLNKILVFYDADDKKEIEWVNEFLKEQNKQKDHKKNIKLILVNGSILNEEKRTLSPIYFDQSSRLTNRFGIKNVPATVRQEGLFLRITEVKA